MFTAHVSLTLFLLSAHTRTECHLPSGMCFIVGCVILGAFSLGGGFVQTKVSMFILRAFAGKLFLFQSLLQPPR